MRSINKKSWITLMILFGSVSLFGQTNLTFDDWDDDDNSLISRSEFVMEFSENYYNDWNQTEDPYLDDEDFHLVAFDTWDVDGDELLSVEEWHDGFDYYYGEYVTSDFEAVDVDGDGFIEYAEYYEVINDTDLYMDLDLDGDAYLNEYELARGVFNYWDVDNSNFIEFDEYNDFDSYYLEI